MLKKKTKYTLIRKRSAKSSNKKVTNHVSPSTAVLQPSSNVKLQLSAIIMSQLANMPSSDVLSQSSTAQPSSAMPPSTSAAPSSSSHPPVPDIHPNTYYLFLMSLYQKIVSVCNECRGQFLNDFTSLPDTYDLIVVSKEKKEMS